MYCDISVMLSAVVFILLRACLNLKEKWWRWCNEPCNTIGHSCTKCNVGKNGLFCEACKRWEVTAKCFVLEIWAPAACSEEIISVEHQEFAWQVCAKRDLFVAEWYCHVPIKGTVQGKNSACLKQVSTYLSIQLPFGHLNTVSGSQ